MAKKFLFCFNAALLFLCSTVCFAAGDTLNVTLEGLNKAETELVLSNLSIKCAEQESTLTKERIDALYQIAIEEIHTTLQAIGYYHPKVKAELLRTNTGYCAYYAISLGEPLRIQKVSIQLRGEGCHSPELNAVIQCTPLKRGAILNHKIYDYFKQELLSKALQWGYLDAVFSFNEIQIDSKRNTAAIILELDTGKRYAFGKITFEKPPYPVEYLNRYLPFTTGCPYSTEEILSLQKALTETDLFTKVRIDPQTAETEEYTIPLKIRLTPRPPNKYLASIGYGTDVGMRGMVGFERRRTAYPGHRVVGKLRGSKRWNEATLQYIIPGQNPATDKLILGSRLVEEKPPDDKYILRQDLGVTKIDRRGRIEKIYALQYRYEVDREQPDDPKKYSHFLLPSVAFIWTDVKKECPYQYGARLSLTLRGSVDLLFSSSNLFQVEPRFKWIIPLNDLTRFILRGDFGATAAPKEAEIPYSLLYFTGGDQTIRGYGYKSLGPTQQDEDGNVITIGGRYLAVGSIEIERMLYKSLSIAAFVDSGNAMNKLSARLKTGVGCGLRYKTPLGALRFDVARPMLPGKHRPRAYLSFGMDLQ